VLLLWVLLGAACLSFTARERTVRAQVAATAPAAPLEVAAAQEAPVPVAPEEQVGAPPAAPHPVLPSLIKLTEEGCCTQPFFSADGNSVLYYDQPPGGPGGTWGIDVRTGQATLWNPLWGAHSLNRQYLTIPRPQDRITEVYHLPSGRHWTLATTTTLVFSPDGTLVAYAASAPSALPGQQPPFRLSSIWIAGADGQQAHQVQLPISGVVVTWLPDNQRLILSGRRMQQEDPAVWRYDLRDGSLALLHRARRLTGFLPSPDGAWVIYMAAWQPDSAENGLWVLNTDTGQRRKLDLVGSYRWSDDGRLFVIPVRATAEDSHEVWVVNPATGERARLTDPAQTRFRIANYDWALSPDGSKIAFVSAGDRSLWLLTLPPGMPGEPSATPPVPQFPEPRTRPYRLPFATSPGPSTWYVIQWYGVTTGGYRGRNSTYSQGQGIHFGIDLPAPCGTPVLAIAPGRVLAVDGPYGSPPHNVVLLLDDGNQVVYGHLLERSHFVQVGQRVQPGDVVGLSGDSTGRPSCDGNPHLHLEIRKGGRAIATNPILYIEGNWDDYSLGLYPGPRFERDLDTPRRWQFMDDQPDIRFGGPIITNFARPWPP
jgi:murein DD-endopeptidase MepM/ murein hydrolase activator NlpD